MGSEPKKRKIDEQSSRRPPSTTPVRKDEVEKLGNSLSTRTAHSGGINVKIVQARNFAVAHAQQDGCTGNYRVFDSPYGNFLVPVIPTRAELVGQLQKCEAKECPDIQMQTK